MGLLIQIETFKSPPSPSQPQIKAQSKSDST